jgi:hypothetical protein
MYCLKPPPLCSGNRHHVQKAQYETTNILTFFKTFSSVHSFYFILKGQIVSLHFTFGSNMFILHLHLSHLADALIQSDLQIDMVDVRI